MVNKNKKKTHHSKKILLLKIQVLEKVLLFLKENQVLHFKKAQKF